MDAIVIEIQYPVLWIFVEMYLNNSKSYCNYSSCDYCFHNKVIISLFRFYYWTIWSAFEFCVSISMDMKWPWIDLNWNELRTTVHWEYEMEWWRHRLLKQHSLSCDIGTSALFKCSPKKKERRKKPMHELDRICICVFYIIWT